MASLPKSSMIFLAVLAVILPARAQLDPNYYDYICPQALPTIRRIVEQSVANEPRLGASLLRLHFHDCFVNGCDGSILLDDTSNLVGEKTAPPNRSLRGFEVVDRIKEAVDSACKDYVVSCADILAVAARDSVVALGGRSYEVLLGRRDSRTASLNDVRNSLPPPSSNRADLEEKFRAQGLSTKDLVVLSGAHTIGQAACRSFRDRIYNDSDIDAGFASSLRERCPSSGNDDNLAPLDPTANRFDVAYYSELSHRKGLLHSDQQLFQGDDSESDNLVKHYSTNLGSFWDDFGVSMIRMGNIRPRTGDSGEIRRRCGAVN
ncbi:unnamed protein product [Spirodela intermedia]|uniref:Peroxidase n=1 Tax=Spirodela intermedia TaxID=51605 RepID=A0A7I8K0K2_SPIIN|nr:unnamed protein product [Spirodela intermedia]